MGKRAARNRALTPVTLGWIVKKKWKGADDKFHERTISKRMISWSAADIFRGIAERGNAVVEGETEVAYFVTEDGGFDDIPAGT